MNHPGAEGLRVTLAWGPVSCQVPAPGCPVHPRERHALKWRPLTPPESSGVRRMEQAVGRARLGLCDL